MTTAQSNHHVRNIIVAIGVVIVLCLVVYGVTLGVSYARVQSCVGAIQQEEQSLRSAIDDVDIPKAHTAAENLAAHVADLKSELDGWQWSVVTVVPRYGSDVVAGRQLATVADSLMQDVVLPTASIASDYAKAVSDKGILGVFDTELATKVGSALTEAAPAITAANAALNAIQPADSDAINQAVADLRNPVGKVAHLLNEYGTLVGHLEGLLPAAK